MSGISSASQRFRVHIGRGPAGESIAQSGEVGYRWILMLFLAEAVVLAVLQLPISQDFKLFAFYDPGSALRADGLLAAGLRPTVDFAYSYGLLPLGVGQVWFGLFGRTPTAYGALTFLGALAVAWGMARFMAALGGKWLGVVTCAVAMPYAIVPYYLNQTHAMEAVILVHALAEHARGRRGRALVLAALGAFVKPSMAYAYGFLLVGCMVMAGVRHGRGGWWNMVREMVPAGVVAVVMAGVLGWVYGGLALVHTLLPLHAGKSYRAANFGFFFGVGREFWWPSTGRTVGYYLFTEAGFWLAATLVVTGLGVWLLGKVWRQGRQKAATEALICVIGMHLVFVFLLYAWRGSWIYYPYLLVMALAGVLGRMGPRWGWRVGAGLMVLALLGQGCNMFQWRDVWLYKVKGAETAGLFGYKDLVDEWTVVRGKIAGRKEFLLTNGYADKLMVPPLKGVESWFMSPALQTAGEMGRIRKAIGEAEVVVRWNELGVLDPWLSAEVGEETAGFEVEWKGQYVTLMKRLGAKP